MRLILAKHLSLPIKNGDRGKILHITDTHLFGDDNRTLLGVNSNASFLAVMDEIENQRKDFDLIVATGDFVQDGSKEAYQRFAKRIAQLNVPCVWLAGNHDIYTYMDDVFHVYNLANEKVILLGKYWLIILLNSQVVDHAYGSLSQVELAFLEQTLQSYPNRFALVFLHHHPILSGCDWLDNHALNNRDALELIVKKTPQLKGLGWGHTHQQQEHIWHHCYAFSTPSTCVQFKSKCRDFELSNEDSPGWREIELLAQGDIKTQVYHILDSLFLADLSLCGY